MSFLSGVWPFLLTLAGQVQNSAIGTGIRESDWTFPLIETTHVLGLTLSVGTVVWFDLRLLGLVMRRQTVSEVHKQVMPWALIGFFIMMVSGVFLLWSEALRCITSIWFQLKVLALFLAGVNALIFEMTTHKSIAEWDKAPIPPLKARMAGLLSIVLWIAVITAGRATAYNLF